MSSMLPTPEQSTSGTSPAAATPSSQSSKPQRVLACALCQQRKVRCDRKVPCANCIKGRVQCVPATLAPRQRRRRFPERVLLERLRKYEHMLRQNNLRFEPLHKDSTGEKDYSNADDNDHLDVEQPGVTGADSSSPATTIKSERTYEPKNYWHAMSQGFRDSPGDSDSSFEEVRRVSFKKVWDQSFPRNDHLLLGARNTTVDLSTLHPEPVQIFRLWQTYLDNVNPLLKVSHAPSLQARIIEAASNVTNISPNLEALMFSVYCMSIFSLAAEDCQAMFASSRENLLTRYQFGCQEALFNCEYLRTGDLDCLTALFLYLVSLPIVPSSVNPSTDPRTMSSMLGVATRIARRIGCHSESGNTRCSALEAEMRRRVWWSLSIFDTRVGELADYKTTTLSPIFDCKTLLNINDSDLRTELREPPTVHGIPTEAIFAVLRSEVANFVRHTTFYLDFTNPALKPVTKDDQQDVNAESSELAPLEKMIEEKYLRFCDPDNPLHFMTIWTTRYYIAKYRLMEHYWKISVSTVAQMDTQRDTALSIALNMLEGDTKILSDPRTKGYRWLFYLYFPFPAYIYTIQDLGSRNKQAARAWEVMSDNYKARCALTATNGSAIFTFFSRIVLAAWKAHEAACGQTGQSLTPPGIVSQIRSQLAEKAQKSPDLGEPGGFMDIGIDDFSMSMPLGFGNPFPLYGVVGQGDFAGIDATASSRLPAPVSVDGGMDQLKWAAWTGV